MLFKQLVGLTISALLTIGNNGFVSPAITWLNNSSLNITIGSSVNYYFDLEFNEWYPASGSVDTGGTGRCDTNIIIGNGTDPMTGFIQYDRSSITRGTNLISYDDNVAVTSNMIYFYNVSSFTLTTFTSTDTGDLNQPTFTVNFTDGYIWDERDDSDLYALMNLMLGDISAIKQNETNVYNAVVAMGTQLGLVKSSIDGMALNIVSIDSKLDNIISYLSTINGNINNVYALLNKIRNFQIPIYSYQAYYSCLQSYNLFDFATDFTGFSNAYEKMNFISSYPVLSMKTGTGNAYFYFVAKQNRDYYFLFMSPNSFVPFSFQAVSDNSTIPLTVNRIDAYPYMYSVKWNSSNKNAIRIVSNYNTLMIPIYIGNAESVPDELAALFDIDKYSSVTNPLNQANDDLENAYSQEDTLIQTVTSDLDNNVPTVTTQDSVLGSQSFFNAANWVKTQFDRITITEAPILGNLLSFSLIIGLAIAFIGRRLGD